MLARTHIHAPRSRRHTHTHTSLARTHTHTHFARADTHTHTHTHTPCSRGDTPLPTSREYMALYPPSIERVITHTYAFPSTIQTPRPTKQLSAPLFTKSLPESLLATYRLLQLPSPLPPPGTPPSPLPPPGTLSSPLPQPGLLLLLARTLSAQAPLSLRPFLPSTPALGTTCWRNGLHASGTWHI